MSALRPAIQARWSVLGNYDGDYVGRVVVKPLKSLDINVPKVIFCNEIASEVHDALYHMTLAFANRKAIRKSPSLQQ
jgi:hypothetical protein